MIQIQEFFNGIFTIAGVGQFYKFCW